MLEVKHFKNYTRIYALQNVSIAYDKIKYDNFDMLAILERFLKIFQQSIENMTKLNIYNWESLNTELYNHKSKRG